MGIKGLNPFLKKKCPQAFVEICKSYFKGKRIGIDSNNILYRFKSRAHKEIVNKTDVTMHEPDPDEINRRWIYHVMNFVIDWLKIGATPIFIFDGKHIIQKTKTQQKRRDDRDKMINAAEEMKIAILEIDELERTPAMVTELRKKMQNLSTMPKDDKEMMMNILSAIGLPVLVATGEAEKLGATLCIEGRIDAVYSRDTDLVAFGCPLVINEPGGYIPNPETGNVEESVKCTIFKPILSALNMEYETFLELCIMAGCDFNDNIPHIGIGKSYNELLKCKRIENLPLKYHTKSTCVKHETCKEIHETYEDQTECLAQLVCRNAFAYGPSENFCQGEIVLDINTDLSDARDILEMYGAENWIGEIGPLYRNMVYPHNKIIPKHPSLNRSTVRLVVPGGSNGSNGSNSPTKATSKIVIDNVSNTINNKKISHLNKQQLERIKQRQKVIPVKLNILRP